MEFSIRQYADVSTGYVEKSDLPLLLYTHAPGHIANIDGDFGSIFYVSDDEANFQEALEQYKELGFSQRFLDIMRAAADRGIQYIRFDADGDEIQGLKFVEE